MRSSPNLLPLAAAALAAWGTALAPAAPADTGAAPARVLVVTECQPRQLVCRDAAVAVEETLAASATPVEIYFEHLDTGRLGPIRDRALAARHLAAKYAGLPPSLVIAYSDEAADLVVEQRAALWPAAAVVAFGLDRLHPGFPPEVTQLMRPVSEYNVAGTVAAGLRMLPGTRTLTYVGGAGPADAFGLSVVRDQMRRQLPHVPVVELVGLSMAETLDRVSRLPDDTLVYSFGIFVDGGGHRFVPYESLLSIVERSSRPVFGVTASTLGNGIVGGYLSDTGAEARRAAQVAVRVLAGEPPPQRSVSASVPVPMFDWRQLRRWGIREADLPPGSIVRYRGPSFLERYGWWLALAVLQAAFIAGLLVERRLRRQAARAAAASESLNRSVIASLPGMIAILDRRGTLLKVNEAWAAHTPGGPAGPLVGQHPGADARAACVPAGDPVAAQTLHALDAVLRAGAPEASFEFAHPAGGAVTWFGFRVQVLERPEGGAVLACQNITRAKVREFEDRHVLQEIAHASRVTTLGELAASLAHEINQPLAAILSNAQAAATMLKAERPDLDLVREAVDDIASNDRRAGQVIRRMRTMLQKGEPERVPVALSDVAGDVLALLAPEATLRRVFLQADLDHRLPPVAGDPVQLQQVVLNLVVNAIDATGAAEEGDRTVTVLTREAGGHVELEVRDAGTGIAAEDLPRLFTPFFTTKPTGLGMGLSIAKSIVEAHGGRIEAGNNAGRGARFLCRLPVAPGTGA